MNGKELGKLLTSIILVQAVGLLGSLATFTSINSWYKTLVKPMLNPPNWVFGPVWTILYILMGASLYLVWTKGLKKRNVRFAFWLFIVHLAFNAGWSLVFFGLRFPFGGLVVLIILWMMIIAVMVKFYPISKWAAYLLVPYFLWVTVAAYLNAGVWLLNR